VECNDPNGACVDGACVCKLGFEGDDCSVVSADKFLGSYTVNAGCSSASYFSTIVATEDGDGNVVNGFVEIHNFGNTQCPSSGEIRVLARVASDSIYIDPEPYCVEGGFGGFTFSSASGVISGNNLTMTYTREYTQQGNLVTETCTDVFQK